MTSRSLSAEFTGKMTIKISSYMRYGSFNNVRDRLSQNNMKTSRLDQTFLVAHSWRGLLYHILATLSFEHEYSLSNSDYICGKIFHYLLFHLRMRIQSTPKQVPILFSIELHTKCWIWVWQVHPGKKGRMHRGHQPWRKYRCTTQPPASPGSTIAQVWKQYSWMIIRSHIMFNTLRSGDNELRTWYYEYNMHSVQVH